jgi:hypothetical protein
MQTLPFQDTSKKIDLSREYSLQKEKYALKKQWAILEVIKGDRDKI